MRTPNGGSYTVAIRNGKRTVARQNVTYNGPSFSFSGVAVSWAGNGITGVNATVRNTGDLPGKVSSVGYGVGGQRVSGSVGAWLQSGESTRVSAGPGGKPVTITTPGTARGNVTVRTSTKTLRHAFSKSLAAPALTVTSLSATWKHATLKRLKLSVQNPGDIATTANVSLRSGSTVVASTSERTINAGATEAFTLGSGGLYHASPNESLSAAVTTPNRTVSRRIANNATPATLAIGSANAVWNHDHLESINLTVSDTGDVGGGVDAAVSVNGVAVTLAAPSFSVPAGGSSSKYLANGNNPVFKATRNRDYTVGLSLSGPGGSHASTSMTHHVSAPHASISGISAKFGAASGSNATLKQVSFNVTNTGDLSLAFSQARVGLVTQYSGKAAVQPVLVGIGGKRKLAPGKSMYLTTSSIGRTVSKGTDQLTVRLTDGSGTARPGTGITQVTVP